MRHSVRRSGRLLAGCPRAPRLLSGCRWMSSVDTDEVIIKEVRKENGRNAAHIVLNRPKALNALSLNMVHKLYPKYAEWTKPQSNTDLIVMEGAGGKGFCAGGDIRDIYEDGKDGHPGQICRSFFADEYQLNFRIATLPLPQVALIHGITMGGGVGLSVHGQFRVATEKTMFAMPETGIGFFCDVGGSIFLPKLEGNLGMYLGLTGHRLKGYDALVAGVATHYVASEKLASLKGRLLSLDRPSLADVEHSISSFATNVGEDTLSPLREQIETCFSGKTVEDIVVSLQRDNSEWAKKTLKIMGRMSPSSLKVVHKQLLEGARLEGDPKACLEMEYRLSQRFMERPDFFEGVRAVLVDKDNSPVWNPATLEEVTDEMVDAYFAPLPADRELHVVHD